MVEPEAAPDVSNPPPAHEVALVELQVRVDPCPRKTVAGLALSAAVGAGVAGGVEVGDEGDAGGGADMPTGAAVHGVPVVPLPQQVANQLPSSGFEGLEVSPHGSSMTIPFAAKVRLGLAPLAETGSKLAWT